MADDKKYLRNLIYALFVMAAAFAFFSVSVCAEEGDWVEIVSVTPNSYDNYTDSVTFTATINYSLQSAEQGIVYLGFNTSQPNYYEIEEEPGPAGQVVTRGEGTVILSKEVTPANWDTAISRMQQYMQGISYPVTDFKIYANISEYPHDIPWTPLAIYEAVLTDLPETEASPNEPAKYDNWSEAYEDFVLGHLFLNAGDSNCGYGDLYGEYDVVSFCLHDMDRDDTPELFIFNGFNGRDLRADYIFSYDGTEIRYCGNVLTELYCVADYPGIFSTVYTSGYYMEDEYFDKYSGVTYLNHSTLEEYSVVTNRVEITGDLLDGDGETVIFRTDDTGLYNASKQTQYSGFRYMTLAEIEEQGWEAFLRMYYGEEETGYTVNSVPVKFNGDITIDLNWGWELFDRDASKYSQDLAMAALVLSQAAELSEEDAMKRMMELGFQNPWPVNYDSSSDMPAAIFASKKINIQGERYIIAVAVRGTSRFRDGLTDLWSQFDGFLGAGGAVKRKLEEYILDMEKYYGYKLTSDNTVFFITGHSLGGAVAGLLSDSMRDYADMNKMFVYTFASPNYDTQNNDYKSYINVHNIINKRDIVPNVPVGYKRYGNDWYVDSKNCGNYDKTIYEMTADDNLWHNHLLSTYLACMLYTTISDDANWYSISSIHCPVDIQVLDDNGVLQGWTSGESVFYSDDCNVIILTDGDAKYVYAPEDMGYAIIFIGTDNGDMSFTQQIRASDTGEVIEEKVFRNIDLTDGKRMSADIGGEILTSMIQLFVLDDEDIKIAEIQEDGMEISLLEVNDIDSTAGETDKEEDEVAEKSTEIAEPIEDKAEEDSTEENATQKLSVIGVSVIFVSGACILAIVVVFLRIAAKRRKK